MKKVYIISIKQIRKQRLKEFCIITDSQTGSGAKTIQTQVFSTQSTQCVFHYHTLAFITMIPLSLECILLQISGMHSLRTGSISRSFSCYRTPITIIKLFILSLLLMFVLTARLVFQSIRIVLLFFVPLCPANIQYPALYEKLSRIKHQLRVLWFIWYGIKQKQNFVLIFKVPYCFELLISFSSRCRYKIQNKVRI